MKFWTTGGLGPHTWQDIVLKPLGADGRLFMPEKWPHIDSWDFRNRADYQGLFYLIMSLFVDVPRMTLMGIIRRAYTAVAFGNEKIVQVPQIGEGVYLAKVSEGPTWSFKDMALRFLAQLLEYLLEELDRHIIIVVATSGDTGSAVIDAMRGMKRVTVFVLSPKGGTMSPLQRAQMYSVNAPNIFNYAVEGTFDDCQALAKALLLDPELQKRGTSGANSINLIRVLAQSVYYFEICRQTGATVDRPATIIVPSGNAGNITAAHAAREMGAPIAKLIAATNVNNVLHRFTQTGEYRKTEKHDSLSPSMDIDISSNWERIIFSMFGQDPALIARVMEELKANGSFNLSQHPNFPAFQQAFGSGWATDEETLQSIRDTEREFNVTVDPHTAVGFKVLQEHRHPGGIYVVVETALKGKFEATMEKATGKKPELPPGAAEMLAADDYSITMPNEFDTIKQHMLAHTH